MSDNGKKRRSGPPGGDGGPRKKKGHYLHAASGRTTDKAIPLGAVGVLVTCDAGREFKAFDEMIRLLEESFQRLGKDHVGRTTTAATPSQPAAADAAAAVDSDTAPAADTKAAEPNAAAEGAATAAAAAAKPRSIAAQLAAEVADLKKERVHRFRRHTTDVRGTVFVEFPKDEGCPSPETVALDIAQHVKATRSLPARYVLRLLPVSVTSFASIEELRKMTADMVARFFPTEGDIASQSADFAVEFEHRSSDKLKRAEVIDIVAKAVPQPPYKVNLNNPSRTILVQLVRNVAALSVVSSFKQLAKFNLRRLTEEEDEEKEKEKGEEKEQQKAARQGAAAKEAEEKPGNATAAAAAATDAAEPAAEAVGAADGTAEAAVAAAQVTAQDG